MNSYNLYAYCENDPVNGADPSGKAKISTSQYSNRYWLAKLISKYIPNIYSADMRTLTLYNRSCLGVGIKIEVALAAQSNANGIFGGMFNRGTIEVSAFAGITDKLSFAFSAGCTWTKMYLKMGLLFSPTNSGLYFALTLELSVSYITAAVIIAGCAVVPYLGTFLAYVSSTIKASIATAAPILIPALPNLVSKFA